jgi:hypothetical protein
MSASAASPEGMTRRMVEGPIRSGETFSLPGGDDFACAARAVTASADTPETRPLLDMALDWIVRLKSGEATEDDLETLQRWRAMSPRHEDAFRAAARIWRHVSVAARELAEETRAQDESAVSTPSTSAE